MNIEREDTGTLTATLKVKLSPEDYAPGVEKALKEQRKQAALPGFRPGQVPMAIIRKRVGKAILVNEVERLIGEGLQDYIRTHELRVLGQPLPRNEARDANNWDEPGEFEFAYELGVAPTMEIQLGKELGVSYPVVDVTDALVDQEVADMRRRFGKLEDATESSGQDMLLGDMIELDEAGAIREGGIMARATITLDAITDEATRTALTGIPPGTEVQVDPHKVSRDHEDLARMLGIEHAQVHGLGGKFLFRVAEIKRMMPAELDSTLFDRVYGQGAVTDEAAFRERVKQGLEAAFRRDSDKLFKREVIKQLLVRHALELPDAFLKRWIMETSEKPITPEQVEEGYAGYADGLKRQLLQDRLVEQYGLEAKGEELQAFAERYVSDQFMQYGMPAPEGERLQQMVTRIVSDREQLGRMRDTIVEQKVMLHLKTLLEPGEQRMSYEEFVNLARSH